MINRSGRRIGFLAVLSVLASCCIVGAGHNTSAAVAAQPPQLLDSFSTARDADPTYGLNDSLKVRQSGTARGVTYTRVSGRWDTGATLDPSFTQVNSTAFPAALSFWEHTSAVRLDAPATADAADTYQVSATVDPDPAAHGVAGDWNSIMLTPSPTSWGYVTNTEIKAGVTVARNGDVELWRNGTAQWTIHATRSTTLPGYAVNLAVSGASSANPSLIVTVNGISRTTALGSPLPLAYVYLGAYISNSSTTAAEVSTATDLSVSHISRFVDTFAGASDTSPDYGLASNLANRQSPLNQERFTRVSGRWDTGALLDPSYTQVNSTAFPSALSFWINTSAVRLNAPVSTDSTDAYQLRMTVNPDPAARGAAADWNSILLSSSGTSWGYVTNSEINVGVTVSHNGDVELFQHGAALWTFNATRSTTLPGYDVSLSVTSASSAHPSLTVTVNGVARTTSLSAPLAKPYLYLGAYLSNNNASSGEVSTLTNLQISRVDEYPNLAYFGYYGARNDPSSGNHVADVSGFSNFSWINIDPATNVETTPPTYAISDLASCAPHSCVLYVGSEFFDPHCASACRIYPTLDRWHEFVRQIMPYQDRIAALYLKDEPYYYGVTPADLDASAQAVKDSFAVPTQPGVARFGPFPIMLNLNVYGTGGLTSSTHIPPAVDWVGADWYRFDSAGLDSMLSTLDHLTSSSQRTFIFPPTVVASYTTPDYSTQQQITALQTMYMNAAKAHPKVVAILEFGLWVLASAQDVRQYPPQIPQTFDLEERLATAVTVKE